MLGTENPLPAVLIAFPARTHSDVDSVRRLVEAFATESGVDIVQSDLGWLQRLNAIVDLLRRGIWILVGLFGAGVLLIVGNTIRLGIQNQHQEIEIAKLVGATDAFIRRPFFYTGLWYGLLGGLIAWSLLLATFQLLQGPVDELSTLYHSQYQLNGPGNSAVLILVAGGGLLGVLGSWVALARQLHGIQPS